MLSIFCGRSESSWPVSLGQLTSRGKRQHQELGRWRFDKLWPTRQLSWLIWHWCCRWLRKRYSDFLSHDYSEKEVSIWAIILFADRRWYNGDAGLHKKHWCWSNLDVCCCQSSRAVPAWGVVLKLLIHTGDKWLEEKYYFIAATWNLTQPSIGNLCQFTQWVKSGPTIGFQNLKSSNDLARKFEICNCRLLNPRTIFSPVTLTVRSSRSCTRRFLRDKSWRRSTSKMRKCLGN